MIRPSFVAVGLCFAAALTLSATAAPVAVDEPADAKLASAPLSGEAPVYRPETPRPAQATQPADESAATTEPAAELEDFDTLTGDLGGSRTSLAANGITFDLTLVGELAKNFRGGLDTESGTAQSLVNLNLTFDTAPLLHWQGGTMFVSLQSHGGNTPSDRLVGDWQGTSSIDADARDQISEAWISQSFADDVLMVKIGKIDVTGDLAYAELGGEFMNTAMGYPISAVGMPTYPDPAFGAIFIARPSENLYFGGGVFDGALQEGTPTGSRGPATLFGSPSDLFLIAEIGVEWTLSEERPGRFRVGILHSTGDLERFDGSSGHADPGFYVMLEQRLWRELPGVEDDGQGLSAFATYDHADSSFFDVQHHVSAGIAWQGMIPTRHEDIAGLGITWASFTDASDAGFTADAETAIELFYSARVWRGLWVQPDLQFIHSPGGDVDIDDALLFSLRVTATF